MEKLEILIVEDKLEDFNTLKRGIKSVCDEEVQFHHAIDADSIDNVLSETSNIGMIFMDLLLSENDTTYAGFEAIEQILSTYITIPIVIITGHFKDTIHDAIRQQTIDPQNRIISILDKMDYTDEDLYVAIDKCTIWNYQYEESLVKQNEINDLLIRYESDLAKAQEEWSYKINELGKSDRHPAKDKNAYRDYIILTKSIKAIDPDLTLEKKAISDLIKLSTTDSNYIDSFFRTIKNKRLIGKNDNRLIRKTKGIWEHKSGSFRIYFSKSNRNITILNVAHKNKQKKIINSFC